MEDRYLTSLEKVQMITMLGIIRRRLRYLFSFIIISYKSLHSIEMKFYVRFANN
jgi:hypothetical protein